MRFTSRYMPCDDCGGSVERSVAHAHRCDPERLADFRLFHLREEVALFEHDVSEWLRTSTGRFESWLAARQVRQA